MLMQSLRVFDCGKSAVVVVTEGGWMGPIEGG